MHPKKSQISEATIDGLTNKGRASLKSIPNWLKTKNIFKLLFNLAVKFTHKTFTK